MQWKIDIANALNAGFVLYQAMDKLEDMDVSLKMSASLRGANASNLNDSNEASYL